MFGFVVFVVGKNFMSGRITEGGEEGESPSSRQRRGLPGMFRARMAVVRGPWTPRMAPIWCRFGSWARALRPCQIERMLPTLQLGVIMELPSRGSKAIV